MLPAVFLDRDDTLCRNADLPPEAWGRARPGDLLNPEFVRLLPGALEACIRLQSLGLTLVLVTNQGGVAFSGGTLRDVEACNDRLSQLLTHQGRPLITASYAAPHHIGGSDPRFAIDENWRKPQPGMVLAAARELSLDLARSWFIGDKPRDVEAGIAAGLNPTHCLRIGPGQRFEDLAAAAAHIERSLAPTPPPHIVPASTVSLEADDIALLGSVWPTIRAAASAIAERTGVQMLRLELVGPRLIATLATHRLAALGFAAELRRQTNHWARTRLGRPLWRDDPRPDTNNSTTDDIPEEPWDSSSWFQGHDPEDDPDTDDHGDRNA